MNNSILYVFFLVIISLWPHQILATDAFNGSDLITSACSHTMYKDLCIDSLRSDGSPQSKQVNLHDLAEFALKLAASNASDISQHISQLTDNTSEPFLQQCLSDCGEHYVDAIDQIQDSIAALGSKGYDDVNMWVTAAMADAEACEDGFKDKPGYESPMTAKNKIFGQLCSNALAIVNLLAGM